MHGDDEVLEPTRPGVILIMTNCIIPLLRVRAASKLRNGRFFRQRPLASPLSDLEVASDPLVKGLTVCGCATIRVMCL